MRGRCGIRIVSGMDGERDNGGRVRQEAGRSSHQSRRPLGKGSGDGGGRKKKEKGKRSGRGDRAG